MLRLFHRQGVRDMDLQAILSHFQLPSAVVAITSLAHGRINDTYRILCDNGEYFGLQRINHQVFPQVDHLMHNLVAISTHIQNQPHALVPLVFVPTTTGAYYLHHHQSYFRVFHWIANTIIYDCLLYTS